MRPSSNFGTPTFTEENFEQVYALLIGAIENEAWGLAHRALVLMEIGITGQRPNEALVCKNRSGEPSADSVMAEVNRVLAEQEDRKHDAAE